MSGIDERVTPVDPRPEVVPRPLITFACFATRRRRTSLWTVRLYPGITAPHPDSLVDDFDSETDEFSFADVSAGRIFHAAVQMPPPGRSMESSRSRSYTIS